MNENHGRSGEGRLYVVATPIGNLEDVTLRALRVLRESDVIAAEDTRVTARLLAHHGIAKRPVSLHAHNERAMTARLLEWLSAGRDVALVTDAGTPAISDPGSLAVREVREAGFAVIPVPGPSALAAALSVAGIPPGPVLFLGFLPAAREARRRAIADIAASRSALVFYEAPHRVVQTVEDLASGLAGAHERTIVIARELTKLFESVHACRLPEAAAWLQEDPNRTRGEFVLVVEAPPPLPATEDWEVLLRALLEELPLAQAVRIACAATGARRKAVYERALAIAGQPPEGEPLS